MDNVLSFNDISIYSCREIQDVYNESMMNIFITESSYFQDIIHKRSSGVLTESVLLEAEEGRFKKFINTIKEFFKNLWEKIKGFFKKIKEKIHSKNTEVAYNKIKSDIKLLEKNKYNDLEVSDKIEEKFKEEKLNFIFDMSEDIYKTSQNSLQYYNDKMEKFYEETKEIIEHIKTNDKENKQFLRYNPDSEIIRHKNNSKYSSIKGTHEVNKEQFEHLYDTVIKDLEEYIPKSYSVNSKNNGKNIYIEKVKSYEKNNNNTVGSGTAYSYAMKFLTRETESNEYYKKHIQESYNKIEKIVKNVQKQLESITSMSTETANIVKNIMTATNKFVQKALTETTNSISALSYIENRNIYTVNRIIAILNQYGKGTKYEYKG